MANEQHGAASAGTAQASRAAPQAAGPASRPGTAAAATAWRDRLALLRGFLDHPQQVGSVIPSSHRLEKRLARNARLDSARCVVELGPGTGGTTRALLRALTPQAHLLAIELNAGFAQRLGSTIADPRLIVEEGSAEDIARLIAEHRLSAPDAIVSGIPFSTMPPEVADRIAVEIASALAPGGRFVAYQVRAAVAGYATPYLGAPRAEWEWFNIPPLRVFTWTRTN